MIKFLAWGLPLFFLTGCSQLEAIPYNPTQTPETWLTIQPYIELQVGSRDILIVQPTTTAIVYLLGLVTIGSSLYILSISKGHLSRVWWGIALLLWGVGAILAGTSYEAFSYQIKCAGREACIWTSWWEIFYLLLSVASVDAILVAQAYACTTGKWRKILQQLAIFNFVVYSLMVITGAVIPIKFLISFELLILVSASNIVIFLIINGWRYKKYIQEMDFALLGTWAWLILTIGAYFLYLISSLTQRLWVRGTWFSENDVLHIGLIIWMGYITLVVAPRVEDQHGPGYTEKVETLPNQRI